MNISPNFEDKTLSVNLELPIEDALKVIKDPKAALISKAETSIKNQLLNKSDEKSGLSDKHVSTVACVVGVLAGFKIVSVVIEKAREVKRDKKISKLKKRVSELEKKNQELEARIAQLEKE